MTSPDRYHAMLNGQLTDDGGETCAVGFLWGLSSTTLTNTVSAGSGTAPLLFSAMVYPLIPSTTYYFRAYAANSVGIGYGDILSFTTAGTLPPIPVPPRPKRLSFIDIGLIIGGLGLMLVIGEDKDLVKAVYNTLAKNGWGMHYEAITTTVQRDHPKLKATKQRVLAVLKSNKELFRKVSDEVYFLAGKEEGFTYPLME